MGAMEGGNTGVPPVCVCVEAHTSYNWIGAHATVCGAGGTTRPLPQTGAELSLSSQQRSRMVPGPGMVVLRVRARWSVKTGALWPQGSQ